MSDQRAAEAALEEALFLDLLALGHRAQLRAYGWSMWPLIWPGDLVTLEPPPFTQPPLRPGQVVLARSGGCLRLHRVTALRGGQVELHGDNSPNPDPPVAVEAVLGRAVELRGRGLAWPMGGAALGLGRLSARGSLLRSGLLRAARGLKTARCFDQAQAWAADRFRPASRGG